MLSILRLTTETTETTKRQIPPRRSSVGALVCLISILSSLLLIIEAPITCEAFDKKKIVYLDAIKSGMDVSLQFPTDVYVTQNGEIYILDSGLQMVLIYDENFIPVSVIDKSHGLKSPLSVAVDARGMIYVSEEVTGNAGKGLIQVFDSLGRKKKTIRFEGFAGAKSFRARDIAIDEKGNLYLAGGSCGKLVILNKKGEFIRSIEPFGKKRSGEKKKADVNRVTLKGDHIYLLSQWHGQVQVYDTRGGEKKIRAFGQKGGSPGKLSRAQGLAVGPADGVTYVMDYMRHTLLIYDSSGEFMNEFGGEGWGPGWFSYPKDICIDHKGRLFVADTFNKRVQIFQTRRRKK